MKITNAPIDSISSHPSNVRQGDVGAIAQSLEAHGQYRPIIVQQSTGHIIAGNHTWRAAKALGWTEIAIVALDVDNDEAMRILLVDNRVNDLATYDDAALAELLQSLSDSDLGLDGTGFDGDDLDDLLARLQEWTVDLKTGEGEQSGVKSTKSLNEYAERYENAATRILVCDYANDTYVWLIDQLNTYRSAYGIETNAAAIVRLVAEATGSEPPSE